MAARLGALAASGLYRRRQHRQSPPPVAPRTMSSALANAVCQRCQARFAPTERIVNSSGELYHGHCFVCAQCFRPFPEGLFYEFEGRKYCEHDFQMLFAPCCGACGEFIIGRVIKAMNNSWHPGCFRCELCDVELADLGFQAAQGVAELLGHEEIHDGVERAVEAGEAGGDAVAPGQRALGGARGAAAAAAEHVHRAVDVVGHEADQEDGQHHGDHADRLVLEALLHARALPQAADDQQVAGDRGDEGEGEGQSQGHEGVRRGLLTVQLQADDRREKVGRAKPGLPSTASELQPLAPSLPASFLLRGPFLEDMSVAFLSSGLGACFGGPLAAPLEAALRGPSSREAAGADGEEGLLPSPRHLCRPCHDREKAKGLGKHICRRCHLVIDEQPLMFRSDAYHPDHFSCTHCGKELTAEARELKGELYCLPCHDKMGVPICGACRRPIEGRVVNALGKQWHVEHFVCAKCEKPFLGHRHYEKKGLAYCETHYSQARPTVGPTRARGWPGRATRAQAWREAACLPEPQGACRVTGVLFGDVCYNCSHVIEGDVVSALNKAWCVNCFSCSTCNSKLTLKNKFVEFDMKPVCKRCYEKFPLELKKRLKKLSELAARKAHPKPVGPSSA
ncbi:hypothetical protein MC885_007472 [Smutsia gigantea]|nr:hypothetical protein MC885_007472 [Smutsia gigantea]